MGTKNNYQKLNIVLLICCGIILVTPLIDNKIFPGHDYIFHVSRILSVADAVEKGILPVRIYVDSVQFWGAPVGIFYPSLFNYIPVLFKLIGLPIEICYNLFIIIIFFIGLISSWFGFSLITKSKKIGMLSTVLYISSGYYLLDAYIRSALGELIALSFLPLAIACIIEFISELKVSFKTLFLGVVSISAIIESHVLSTLFLCVFSVICFLGHIINHFANKANEIIFIFKRNIRIVFLVFILNLSFIVPFTSFYFRVPVTIDYVSTFSQVGWPSIIILRFFLLGNVWISLALVFYFVCLCTPKYEYNVLRENFRSKYFWYAFSGILCIWMSSDIFPWDFFYSLKVFFEIMQFPWRFLSIGTFCLCVCGGFGLQLLFTKLRLNNVFAMLMLLLMCTSSLIINIVDYGRFVPVPGWSVEKKVQWSRIKSNTDDDYLYKDMNAVELFKQGNYFFTDAKIYEYKKEITNISFSYFAKTESKIILPLVNYPGYTAIDQNKKYVQILEDKNHMIMIPLQKGTGKIYIYYSGLAIFKIADIVSLLSSIIFLGYSFFIYINKKRELENCE